MEGIYSKQNNYALTKTIRFEANPTQATYEILKSQYLAKNENIDLKKWLEEFEKFVKDLKELLYDNGKLSTQLVIKKNWLST